MNNTSDIKDGNDTSVGNTNSTRDANTTNSTNNNVDSKNAYTKAGFNTYNIASVNVGINTGNTSGTKYAGSINAGDTSDTEDVYGISHANNNSDNKNAYTKACFSIYNITGIDAGETNNTNEKVSNNRNNTSTS